MQNIIISHYQSPFGTLTIGSYGDRLCLCDWQKEKWCADGIMSRRLRKSLHAESEEGTSMILDNVVAQLDEYFAGTRKDFNLPLLFVGTEFQRKVWEGLVTIPYGATMSYGEFAKKIGMPTSVRAVANANGANPISIIVPCHRVIGSDGTLTGYGGGVDTKLSLLALEGTILPMLPD